MDRTQKESFMAYLIFPDGLQRIMKKTQSRWYSSRYSNPGPPRYEKRVAIERAIPQN
jgi:hypothetical protein